MKKIKNQWDYLGYTVYLAASFGARSGIYKIYGIPGQFKTITAAKAAIKKKVGRKKK